MAVIVFVAVGRSNIAALGVGTPGVNMALIVFFMSGSDNAVAISVRSDNTVMIIVAMSGSDNTVVISSWSVAVAASVTVSVDDSSGGMFMGNTVANCFLAMAVSVVMAVVVTVAVGVSRMAA